MFVIGTDRHYIIADIAKIKREVVFVRISPRSSNSNHPYRTASNSSGGFLVPETCHHQAQVIPSLNIFVLREI